MASWLTGGPLKKGKLIEAKVGKNNSIVAYHEGMVCIITNQKKPGFYVVDEITKKDNCYLLKVHKAFNE